MRRRGLSLAIVAVVAAIAISACAAGANRFADGATGLVPMGPAIFTTSAPVEALKVTTSAALPDVKFDSKVWPAKLTVAQTAATEKTQGVAETHGTMRMGGLCNKAGP